MSLGGYDIMDVFHMCAGLDSAIVMADEYGDIDAVNNLKMTMDFLECLIEEGRV